jgi:hypothetical protein
VTSPIEAMIDAACGYQSGDGPGWKVEVARAVLNEAADSLMRTCEEYRTDDGARRCREQAAVLYFAARQARGLRSERAFRAQLRKATRAGKSSTFDPDPPDADSFVEEWTSRLRERQERGW